MSLIMTKEAFVASFQLSKRGNLWRRWAGRGGRELILTVFRQRSGYYDYVVADGDWPAFSTRSYLTEGEAIEALWRELSPCPSA
jgi:hypothetical protein